jgi:hypothetical protein
MLGERVCRYESRSSLDILKREIFARGTPVYFELGFYAGSLCEKGLVCIENLVNVGVHKVCPNGFGKSFCSASRFSRGLD